MNINMPRDKETGKPKGFAFLMYEDQRSTILAVDNLNGANVLERTIRVDHVKNYKEKRIKNEDGEWVDPEEQSLNAKPEVVIGALYRIHPPILPPSAELFNLPNCSR
jgi:RNA-binding motif protein, X-linked 2